MNRFPLVIFAIGCCLVSTISLAQTAVDLGLGVRWASCNLGAEKPHEYGGLYGWADPTGECVDANVYDDEWNWMSDSLYGGYMPTKDICGTLQDIVTAKWGKPWRLPTHEEMEELINRCKKEKAEINGIKGIRFTGPSGNSIFLPAGGRREATDILHQGKTGNYWTDSIGKRYKQHRDSRVWYLFFNTSGYVECSDYGLRYFGFSIRPVRR